MSAKNATTNDNSGTERNHRMRMIYIRQRLLELQKERDMLRDEMQRLKSKRAPETPTRSAGTK